MTATARDRLVPALVVLLMFAGFVKASPAMGWVPVDLTVAAVVLLTVSAAVRLLGNRVRIPRELTPLAILALAFAAPALYSDGTPEANRKMLLLFGITLLAAFTAALLLSERPERGWWLMRWTVLAALGVAILLQFAPSTDDLYGRLALEGSNTIAIGRGTGAGIVAAWMLMRAKRLRLTLGIPIVLVLTAVLFGSGSRGPLLAVAAAIATVAVAQRSSRRMRELLVVIMGGSALTYWALGTTNQFSASRILSLFSTTDRGASVDVRLILIDRSLELVSKDPEGQGWNGLAAHLQPFGVYPHNILVEIFGEAGWMPGIVFVAVIFIALRRSFGAGDLGAALAGLLVYWLANAMVSGDVNDNRMLFAALGAALITPTFPPDTPPARRESETPHAMEGPPHYPTALPKPDRR